MWSVLLNSNLQWVLFSTMILGIAAGTIGCLSYWKKQSLMSDALAHAALPGVVMAYMIFEEKNLFILICGAAISALIGSLFIQVIQSQTRITEDTAMGMILSVFYGVGIMMLTVVNRSAGGNQSGLDSFIMGQAAAMVRSDVMTMLILALAVIFIVVILFKEWKLYLFDADFCKGLGFSSKLMNGLYTALLVTVIVIGIQAVGVILIAALIIIPSVSARYWTYSFKVMIILSAIFGGLSGAVGTLISAMGSGWPTGPFIVVVAASFFLISLFLGKERGVLIQFVQYKIQQKKQLEKVSMQLETKGEE